MYSINLPLKPISIGNSKNKFTVFPLTNIVMLFYTSRTLYNYFEIAFMYVFL